MPRSRARAEQRRQVLLTMLAEDGSVSGAEVAGSLGGSTMPIRRDLQSLERSGCAVRSYGGAVAVQRVTFEFALDRDKQVNVEQKTRIGAAAAGRIQPGQSVFIDTGTTTLEVARALAELRTRCSVATSSLVIASVLWGRDPIELTVLGGRVRRESPDLGGPGSELILDRLTADLAILGAASLDPDRGCFAQDIDYVRVPEIMAANARTVMVVADSSKLGTASGVRFLRTSEVDELITDPGARPEIVAAYRRAGVLTVLV